MSVIYNQLKSTRRLNYSSANAFSIQAQRVFSRPFSFPMESEDPELNGFLDYMDHLKNYEKSGVPRGAGTDSEDGFDLDRMRRLMARFGNPQSKLKVVHIAGTKGKGSTAEFLSNILRQEGYSVGSYTSPHIQTIRERMRVGRSGAPVSTRTLNSLFLETRKMIDEAVGLENGRLSHFEVLTAMAFYLFARENVDFAVVEAGLGGARDATNIVTSSELALSVITTIGEEHLTALGGSLESIATAKSGVIKQGRPLVMGGPFLPHIESIIRKKASLMAAPVVSASDSGNRSVIKAVSKAEDKLYQLCDILMHIKKDIDLSIELPDVNIYMLGSHQLQNAATATCAALCLREQGWKITNDSVRAGLEQTYVPGRSQILTYEETVALNLAGSTVLLDGGSLTHTKESARALVNTIQMTFPEAPLILVVAMANDKDHVAFAREFLNGMQIDAVFLTEVDIAGSKSRTTPCSLLKDYWIEAHEGSGVNLLASKLEDYNDKSGDNLKYSSKHNNTALSAESSLLNAMRTGHDLLQGKGKNGKGIIVVTGSLHIVSSVLAFLRP